MHRLQLNLSNALKNGSVINETILRQLMDMPGLLEREQTKKLCNISDSMAEELFKILKFHSYLKRDIILFI